MLHFLRYARAGQRVCCRVQGVNKSVIRRNNMWEADAPQHYREQVCYIHPFMWYLTAAITGMITFYVGYHFYNHFDHVKGFPKMEPSKWTNEELGIPPDEEDIYPPGYVPLKDRV